ncbi:beta-ketoacyl-[acyl-carrier-protein] synthase family protein [Pinirhizobacter sp.]|uniref:beta-ketoacyl-[acyl-carrier-protein] synthase family protein n=1 Tax=Pinirhizobacter sp. TaxID=2950432 RepID=UPI002F41D3BF
MNAADGDRQVVITGMGAVSALGFGADVLWDAMKAGRVGIAPLLHPRAESLRVRVAAQVPDFDPASFFDERTLPLLDRVSQFGLLAANQAVGQSGIRFDEANGARTAVIVGTGVGGETTQDAQSEKLYGEHAQRLHPLTIVRIMANAVASHICVRHGITGPSFAVSSACASANHAIAQAVLAIRSGLVDVAITGGTEACLSYGVFRAWEAMRVLSDDTCRPFCRQRHGLVLGEGAGVFVIESLAHAKARGADVLAQIAGVGMSADAGDIVAPSDIGAARAMRAALADARMDPAEVDYINAHGTGTLANDTTETRAVHLALGGDAMHPAVSSTKSMHGHALGASGALELIAVVGALGEGVIPPTMNVLDPDPACNLDIVFHTAREVPVRAALSNSFAFGGLNAVLALRA